MPLNTPQRQRDPVRQLTNGLALIAAGIALGVVGALRVPNINADSIQEWAPPIAALIAACTFTLSAYIYARSASRTRQALTFEAWGKWNDGTRKSRREMRNTYPTFTDAQAKALAKMTAHSVDASTASPDEVLLATHAHQIGNYLTGLERIAAGWVRGLYDANELEALGATIIVRLHERHKGYLLALRHERNHATAYEHLDSLAAELLRRNPNMLLAVVP